MTPKRKAALQWFHDAGETTPEDAVRTFGRRMFDLMILDRQIVATHFGPKNWLWSLTDKGRRELHGGK